MRILGTLLLLTSFAAAQEAATTTSSFAQRPQTSQAANHEITIPAGTKVPISLVNAISTKSSHEGDPVYARTTFPVVIDERILVPPGTYMQGRIASIKPAGRMNKRAEVLMHFTHADLSQRLYRRTARIIRERPVRGQSESERQRRYDHRRQR